MSRHYDITRPIVACSPNVDITACDEIPTFYVPTATDNCGGSVQVVPTRSDGLALNAPFPVGVEVTITYTATDGCNNSSSCSFKVLVRPCTLGGYIFPTQTTCCNYVTNSASQLLNVCTTVRTNYVTNAIPGVFFYYSEVTAPSTSFTIEVRQSNDNDLNRLFQVHGYDKNNLQQIRLYTKGCENVPFTTSFISNASGARLVVNGATLGSTYIVSIKYNVKSIICGTYSGADFKSTYTFGNYTQFGGNPFVLSASSVGTLDALAGCKDGTPTPGNCSLTSPIASEEPSVPNLVDSNEPSFIAYPVPFRDVI